MKKLKQFVIAILSIILVACQSKTTTVQQQETKPTALEKVTIVLDYTPNTNHTGIYVAKDKGYFEAAGLDVSIVQPPENGAELTVASGGAQFGISFQDMLAASYAKKMPITTVATILAHNTSGLLSLQSKQIISPKLLTDKNYATWDLPIEQAMIKKVVNDDGGDYAKVNLVVNNAADILTALKTDVDVVWAFEAWDKVFLDLKGEAVNYLRFKDMNPVFDYYTPVIITNNDVLNANKDLVKKFIGAVSKGYTYASEHPQESADILLKHVPELDKALVYKSQEVISTQYIDGHPWGYIDPTRWNNFYQWLNENNLVESTLEMNTGFTNEFIGN